MEPNFWQARWDEGRIGFHKSEVNPLLIEHFSALRLSAGSRVLVPLSGKSLDMAWLATQGYEVVGIELSEIALKEFFAEQDIMPTIRQHSDNSALKYYQGQLAGQTITLWVGDIFALTAKDIGAIDAVYDRAALIALPAEMRSDYAKQILKLCGKTSYAADSSHKDNKKAPQLLITLDYDQSKKEGPPFSVTSAQVEHYYASHYRIIELESSASTLNSATDLAVTEQVWLLKDL